MKWGIVDYYQVTKKSYDYVKRAFQPLLISLQYHKRRWLPGETFEHPNCCTYVVPKKRKAVKNGLYE